MPEQDGHGHKGGNPERGAPSILVIGLGNPILGDDGAGWRVAAGVEARLGAWRRDVTVDYASLGGLSLMERMLGFDRVILTDTMQTGEVPQGSVNHYELSALPNPSLGHTASAHDASLRTALETAEELGAAVPPQVDVVAIEAPPQFEFSESLTPPIAAAVEIAIRKVLTLLGEPDS